MCSILIINNQLNIKQSLNKVAINIIFNYLLNLLIVTNHILQYKKFIKIYNDYWRLIFRLALYKKYL